MKLAFNLSVVSSKRLAAVVWVLAVALGIAGWPLSTYVGRLLLATIGVILAAVLASKRWWFLRCPVHQVLEQIQNTLETCCIDFEVVDKSVKVTSTGTRVYVWGWGPLSLVSLKVRDPQCNKERFLLEVLIKYLRFIGKKDTHG